MNLAYMFGLTSRYILSAVLLSAYDMFYKQVNERDIYIADVVFIDSGGYEARNVDDLGIGFSPHYQPKSWSLDRYREILDNLRPLAQFVVVSYDYRTFSPVPDQIRLARELFRRYPQHASDFLCKPRSPDDPTINVRELVANADGLKQFSILGLTEKELGNSLLERCSNLLSLRSALLEREADIPIHVFGCLEPDLIIAYFLCGADIFDGLSWNRFSLRDGIPIYHRVDALLRDEWEESDMALLFRHWISNLEALGSLSDSMALYCSTRAIDALVACCGDLKKIISLVQRAGLEIGGMR